MKILIVHNYYGSSAPSGENKVFEAERAMLEKRGHEVAVYARHSDEVRNGNVIARLWGMVKGALCTVGNPFAARAVARKCREFKPDVVHFHNTFPLISPLAVRAVSKYAPVVMTLHNYRTACAAGVPTRDGKVCSLCLDKKCVWDGVRHRCYRGSLLATLPLAVNIAVYRKLLPRWVKRFIVLSEFQKRKMVEYGWPEGKIVVRGNFVGSVAGEGDFSRKDRVDRVAGVGGDFSRVERVETCRGEGRFGCVEGEGEDFSRKEHKDCVDGIRRKKEQIVYVGRLSKEKGVETLIKAYRILAAKNAKSAKGE